MLARIKDLVLGQEIFASPAIRPVNRNNLSTRLKKQATFARHFEVKKVV